MTRHQPDTERPLAGKTIAVDVDCVCCDLMPAWLEAYNRTYDDALMPAQVTDWDITKFVKPACGARVYELLTPELWYKAKPIAGALIGVETLRQLGARVVFVTATSINTAGVKLAWLRHHGFLPHDGKPYSLDYIEANDKSMIRADAIIDDKLETCENFNGIGVVFTAPHNEGRDIGIGMRRADSWASIPGMMVAALAPGSLVNRACLCGAVAMPGSNKCPTCTRPQHKLTGAGFVPLNPSYETGKEKKPETVLEEAQRLVYGDREAAYSHPFNDFLRIARVWSGYLDGVNITPGDVAQMMVMLKSCRARVDIVHNRPVKRDTLVDIAGYGECARRVSEREAELRQKDEEAA
jgi:5'(3')-deoxyribonucleotidase